VGNPQAYLKSPLLCRFYNDKSLPGRRARIETDGPPDGKGDSGHILIEFGGFSTLCLFTKMCSPNSPVIRSAPP